jgi:TonB family protein
MSPSHRPRCQNASRFTLFSRPAAFIGLAALFHGAFAEDAKPAAAPVKPPVLDAAPSERAKRDAEKVFHWIKIHADKPRKAAVVKIEKPAAAAPVKVADRPAVKPTRPPVASAGQPAQEQVGAAAVAAAAAASAPQPDPTVAKAGPSVASAAAVPAPEVEEAEDVALIPIVQPEPEFSAYLMRRLRKGLVKVSFMVLPDGSVAQVQAVSSSNSRLEETAVATVTQWRFQPVPQAQQAMVEVGFDLD